MKLDEHKKFMHQMAEASAEIICPLFRDPVLRVERKKDNSVVTAADRNAEELLRDMIRKKYPDHGVIGEEFGNDKEDAEFVWILDPIDGTISFVGGCPLFGTLIGLLHKGQPLIGSINQPILKQFCLGDGEKAWLNGEPCSVSEKDSLSGATLLNTDSRHVKRFQSEKGFEDLIDKVEIMRTWGDCYGYLLLATGFADIMLDPIMNPWDLLPLIPVVRGAGGVITSWTGEDPVLGTSAVAASPGLHSEVIKLLNQ